MIVSIIVHTIDQGRFGNIRHGRPLGMMMIIGIVHGQRDSPDGMMGIIAGITHVTV